jgi:hypothetical protein
MSWMVEWKQWDEQKQDYILCSDFWDKWEDVVRIFNDCIADSLCGGATVYCFLGDKPYTTDDPIVLEYRP